MIHDGGGSGSGVEADRKRERGKKKGRKREESRGELNSFRRDLFSMVKYGFKSGGWRDAR